MIFKTYCVKTGKAIWCVDVIKLVSYEKVAKAVLYSHQPSIAKQLSTSLLMMIAAILSSCLHTHVSTLQLWKRIS